MNKLDQPVAATSILNRLEKLLAESTPGPWNARNAELICALRNNAQALIAVARAAGILLNEVYARHLEIHGQLELEEALAKLEGGLEGGDE